MRPQRLPLHGSLTVMPLDNAGYRKAALEHHPDKAGAAAADEARKAAIEEHFKAIQEAYETLSDPARRREFDSVDDFDDTLPVDCAPADFLKVPNRESVTVAVSENVCSRMQLVERLPSLLLVTDTQK